MVLHYFLGANGAAGFQSLYPAFVDPKRNFDVLVLKGGPGVGKSSFMRYIGEKAETAGEDVEYIWCSGDPKSLDAVRLPRVGVVVVDGTSPHIIEPQYPVAADRYVDLGRFYDVDACKADRDQIIERTEQYKAAYSRAYRALGAAGAVEETIRGLVMEGLDQDRLRRRAAGIAAREFGRRKGDGEISYRYLGGPTCQGKVLRFDTVAAQCPRVYEIRDSFGLSDQLLKPLCQAAQAAGHECILCLDPNHSDAVRHLLLPGLGLAFVTIGDRECFPGETYRRFHLDLLVDDHLRRKNRARLRFHRRVHRALLEEGMGGLKEAKEHHDALERIYNPAVDFDGVYALAEKEWERISGWL